MFDWLRRKRVVIVPPAPPPFAKEERLDTASLEITLMPDCEWAKIVLIVNNERIGWIKYDFRGIEDLIKELKVAQSNMYDRNEK